MENSQGHSIPGRAPSSASRVGANYVPSREWWWAWERWEPSSIQEDLHALAGLGLDHVRIQCLWPVFQPAPDQVSPVALDRFSAVLDMAATASLDVVPTVLDGWLSGFDFRPDWVGVCNIFRDRGILAAQSRLIAAVAREAAAHANVIGLDIGNEINVLAHETPENAVEPGGVDPWARAIVDAARADAAGLPVMIGVDDRPLTDPNSAISTACAATVGDVSCVHAWPYFSGALKRFGFQSPGAYAVADYFTQLFRAHHADPARPVWVQEFGMSPEWLPAEHYEEFVEKQIEATLGIDDLWGATWWASHDIDSRHPGFASLEYGLGLLDVDNEVKPAGRILAAAIKRERRPPQRDGALTVPASPRGIEDADEFVAAYAAGARPRLHLATDNLNPTPTLQEGAHK